MQRVLFQGIYVIMVTSSRGVSLPSSVVTCLLVRLVRAFVDARMATHRNPPRYPLVYGVY